MLLRSHFRGGVSYVLELHPRHSDKVSVLDPVERRRIGRVAEKKEKTSCNILVF